MKTTNVLVSLAALAQQARLAAYRLLVKHAPEGLPARQAAQRLGVPPAKSRFSDEQMVTILREGERTSVAEVAKKNKVSEQTICARRQRFGGLEPADVKRLKALSVENAKRKKLLAELAHTF